MNTNLWIYSTNEEISQTAGSLLVFGAEVFYSAQIIEKLDIFESITHKLNKGEVPIDSNELNNFIFSYLTDSISILIFFENFMKAELLIKGYCVHRIKKDLPKFKDLAKRQFKEPILMQDINAIEPFEINIQEKAMFHRAIKESTIGMKELMSSAKYLDNYQLSEEIINFIRELTRYRNKLHFHDTINFTASLEKVSILKTIKEFVTDTIQNRINSRR